MLSLEANRQTQEAQRKAKTDFSIFWAVIASLALHLIYNTHFHRCRVSSCCLIPLNRRSLFLSQLNHQLEIVSFNNKSILLIYVDAKNASRARTRAHFLSFILEQKIVVKISPQSQAQCFTSEQKSIPQISFCDALTQCQNRSRNWCKHLSCNWNWKHDLASFGGFLSSQWFVVKLLKQWLWHRWSKRHWIQ